MIIIDNFLMDPNQIREDGLELGYTKAEPNSPGWRGFRCLHTTMVGYELDELIRNKLNELDPVEFKDLHLRCYFHYTLDEDMSGTIHTDGIYDYAGVLYLTPNPPPNSGTVFYDGDKEIGYVENVYNRLTLYPATIPHRIKESFGDDITNGRLVYTVFIKFND